jgi:hypothetical protein
MIMKSGAGLRIARRIFSVVALVALPVLASAQQSSSKKYADINGWAVLAYSQDGSYMRCGAIAPGSSGSPISFEKSREGFTLLVPTQAKGDPVRGVVAIDGKTFSGPFYPMDDGRVGMFLKRKQLKTIQGGKSMTVKIGAEETAVSLEGVATALRKVSECDDKAGE